MTDSDSAATPNPIPIYKYSPDRNWFLGSEIRAKILQFVNPSEPQAILEIGCCEAASSLRPHIGVAHVVRNDEHDVETRIGGGTHQQRRGT